MSKIVRLTESNLTKIIRNILNENEFLDEPRDDSFSVEPNVKMIPREKQIQNMFGKYEDQIPNDILRYMRKNPQLMMDRMAKIYGENFIDYAEKAYSKNMKSWKEEY
jgi:hypothetical protein